MSISLNRDDLLHALRAKPEQVNIAGLGTIFICPISTADRMEFLNDGRDLNDSNKPADQMELMLRLLPKVLVDENGNKLLTVDDLEALRQSNARLVQVLIEKALDINGMTSKAVEEIQGN